ncbi:MAG: HNH endonuclease family protein [Candidatus Gallimonas sp.]
MRIELHEIKIRDVVEGYVDGQENGVVGFGGKLNIRPAFQREFVYKEKQRNAVIETVIKGFPLNVMYWVEDEKGNYELLDGQQRTISICQYVNGDFSLNSRAFHNLTETEKTRILDYPLMIYICNGNDQEKLDWFKIINIAGVQLKEQELRNAIYTGEWLSDAKRYFSKNGCVAYLLGSKYLNGEVNRQDYLETVLGWISAREGIKIKDYMSVHQHDSHATPLWMYFQSVISWVQTIFPKYRKEMKGLAWGLLYNRYGDRVFDPHELEEKTVKLMQDDDVTKRSGIYEYLLSGNEKYLNLRAFTDNEKRQVYERQRGICPYCVAEHREKTHYEPEEMEADHITPWCEGGRTNIDNCQMLCKEHNRRKSDR